MRVLGRRTPNAVEVERCEPQTPAESTRNSPIISYYFPLSLHMGPPRRHRRGQKAVLPCMFDSIVVRRGCRWGNFGDGY